MCSCPFGCQTTNQVLLAHLTDVTHNFRHSLAHLHYPSSWSCRFLNSVIELPWDQIKRTPPVLRTKLLHAFLPAMEVDLTPEFGGSADNLLICMAIKCLTDTTNLMVVSHKGAICFASSQLASMLGYPLKTFIKMPLKALMPQPYSLLHDGWMKVGKVHGCYMGVPGLQATWD